ncbi:MATE family efflux transporter [Myxococcus sp. AB025B]|uniref:MATE family efflux transporter n=1 Tax=Myxococcus sp. AB025B TaxID=2562794 RepID=UPI001E529D58|nr:MATE family efflux transporter [Myxococcus sp. AB025B]
MTQPPPDAFSPAATGVRGLLASCWQAVRGSTEDLATGPVDRAFLLLSVPMVLEMVMESIFALVDVLFVSRLGADAIATVGLTEAVLTLFRTVPLGLAVAATALVSRRIGQKDPERAARTAVQALGLGLALSVPLALAGGLFARPILTAMGASPGVVTHGLGYARLMLGGFPIIMLLFLISAILRGAGDAATSMRALWLANSVNIVLAPLFIFGLGPVPALGVTGAAVATTVGRASGVLYQVYRLLQGRGRLELRRVAGPSGRVLVGHAHNRHVDQRGVGGTPLDPAGYAALMPGAACYDDAGFVTRFLDGGAVPDTPLPQLERAEALSFAWPPTPGRRSIDFGVAVPGARLSPNPLLEAHDGRVRPAWPTPGLAAEYVSAHYLCSDAPEDAALLRRAATDATPEQRAALVRRRWLLNLPERW